MDVTASIITIVQTSVSLAQYIKQLVQNSEQQDANAKELENRFDTLTTTLGEASSAYGPQESRSYSSDEEKLRQNVRQIVIDYKGDLEKIRTELKKQTSRKNWVSLAWRQQHAAPVLARIDKSISDRQQQLGLLVQLLHGRELREMREMNERLKALTDSYCPEDPLSTTAAKTVVPNADTEAAHNVAQSREEKLGSQGNLETREDTGSQEARESNANGVLLLEAIQTGDNDNFESLFLDGDTSFQEKDDKDRTPLLLAAHLDMKDIVKRFLADDSLFSPSSNAAPAEDTKTSNHREIDVNLTDSVGRSALHYCAEFGMCDEATILLNHGGNVNARDNLDYPPAYYAARHRKYYVLKLLLEKGADTEFELQIPTASEIDGLLEKASSSD
ncbi:MAG: hypothetical protein Q9190_002404 [Brigantiaea leucoxantha]